MLYEFSIAAQLAGAVILLLWSFGKVSKNAIEMCFPSLSAVDVDEDGNGILKKEIPYPFSATEMSENGFAP